MKDTKRARYFYPHLITPAVGDLAEAARGANATYLVKWRSDNGVVRQIECTTPDLGLVRAFFDGAQSADVHVAISGIVDASLGYATVVRRSDCKVCFGEGWFPPWSRKVKVQTGCECVVP